MPPSQSKEEWTAAELGKLLADECTKSISESFEKMSLQSDFPDSNKDTLFKEWIFFNMFAMFQGISAYFTEPQDGFYIIDHFHHSCGEIFIEKRLFENSSTFNELLLKRYNIYSNELKRTEEPGTLHWLAKKFCQICSCKENISAITIFGISSYWAGNSIINKNLIGDLMKLKGIEKRDI